MKRFIIFLLVLTLMCVEPMQANASNVLGKRYATQTIRLRQKANGKTLRKVKRNTRLYQIRAGKKWTIVKYKGKRYVTIKKYLSEKKSPKKYTGADLRQAGAILWNGNKYTWYSQRVMPDTNNYLGIVGKHLDDQGFICDKWDYIALGSCTSNRGRIVPTPFGKFGKVYDAGWCPNNLYDCYVGW